MCDYSLQAMKSRPAQVGEKLTTHRFSSGSGGFIGSENDNTAVCVLPGTELAFEKEVGLAFSMFVPAVKIEGLTARFRQINLEREYVHHDALEFPDGRVVELNRLAPGQTATVLQLPAAPKTEAEAKEQQRLEVVG